MVFSCLLASYQLLITVDMVHRKKQEEKNKCYLQRLQLAEFHAAGRLNIKTVYSSVRYMRANGRHCFAYQGDDQIVIRGAVSDVATRDDACD